MYFSILKKSSRESDPSDIASFTVSPRNRVENCRSNKQRNILDIVIVYFVIKSHIW